jgi:hypothetical protein
MSQVRDTGVQLIREMLPELAGAIAAPVDPEAFFRIRRLSRRVPGPAGRHQGA